MRTLHAHLGFDADVVGWVEDPEDAGATTTVPALERLASTGLLGLGVADRTGLGEQVGVISALATRSMSVAFSAWAHRMVVEYIGVSGRTPELLTNLAAATTIGSTAMASALRARLGLDRVGLSAEPSPHGYTVSGRIPWASNLHTDRTVIVAAAEVPDGSHVVVVLPLDGRAVTTAPMPALLALQSTASAGVVVDGAVVPTGRVLAEDLDDFLAAVKPTFLVLQSAFAVGLGEAALSRLDRPLTGSDVVFVSDRDALVARHGHLVKGVAGAVGPEGIPVRDLVALRLEAASFAQAAVGLESRAAGGRGFVASSGTARRLREAAFLPIQSPTESQLRWELECSA